MSDGPSRDSSRDPKQDADQPESVMAMAAPRVTRDNPLTRSTAGLIGLIVLSVLVLASLGSIPYTFGAAESPQRARVVDGDLIPTRLGSAVRYNSGDLDATLLPPTWWKHLPEDEQKIQTAAANRATAEIRQSLLDAHNQARVDAYIQENPSERTLSSERVSELGLVVNELPGDVEVPAPTELQIDAARSFHLFGTDNQGRDVFVRTLAGGAISIGIGLAAATLSVVIGTLYGALAGYIGGTIDSLMMRVVDILYGLPYILLVVLLAVAGEALVDRYDNHIRISSASARLAWMHAEADRIAAEESLLPATDVRIELDPPDERAGESEVARYERALGCVATLESESTDGRAARDAVRCIHAYSRSFDVVEAELLATLGGSEDRLAGLAARATEERGLTIRSLSAAQKTTLDVFILLVAIGGVSWLTMARVIRGQVLSLKSQPFMEAARSIGTPVRKQFRWHLLPNLLGPIIVYATLTVPQAILQESFLSFLGIGVQAPLPSWGNLAAQGLTELNTIRSRWWLLLFPCLMLGVTLLALNFVGEGLREAFDPKRARK